MAAGAGYIEFTTGDVLTATAANQYLASQVVMVFASAAARTSAISSPQEGMFSFLKDTNATQYYDGAAWTDVASAGGGETLLSTTTLSGTSTTISIDPTGYNHIRVEVAGMTTSPNNDYPRMDFNGTSALANISGVQGSSAVGVSTEIYWLTGAHEMLKTGGLNTWVVDLYQPTSTSYYKSLNSTSAGQNYAGTYVSGFQGGQLKTASAISSVKITTISGNTFGAGQVKIWGIK